MRNFALLPVLAICLAATPAMALSDKPYLTAEEVDFSNLLPPPPKEDSAEGKRDLQTILDLQKKMTPQWMEAIQRDLDQSVYTVAGPVFGAKFTKENFPLASEFFAKAVRDGGAGVGPIKQKYKKLRPFQYSKDVKTPENIAKAAAGPTYPSGHSATGALIPTLLGYMVPEMREALFARGWEYGVNRMASGAAYPSDFEGGHTSAALSAAQMMKNPAFRADFDAVRAEIRKGLALPL
jgi:acid phosphatase (class A)